MQLKNVRKIIEEIINNIINAEEKKNRFKLFMEWLELK